MRRRSRYPQAPVLNRRRLALIALSGLYLAAVYFPPLQAAPQKTPLTLADWGLIVLAAVPVFVVPEAVKVLRHRAGRA